MGWGYGIDEGGKEIGYSVAAVCDHPGCLEEIDRGLGYACGGMHDAGEWYCDGYFCSSHLYAPSKALPDYVGFLCPNCTDVVEADDSLEDATWFKIMNKLGGSPK